MNPPDLEAMLRRVVRHVVADDVETTWGMPSGSSHVHQVTLSVDAGSGARTVVLAAATTGWFQLSVPDLDVGTFMIEYDDESYMEAILRELALVGAAYLTGHGVVAQRGRFRKRPALTVTVGGNEWTLGHRSSSGPYPAEGSSG